MAKTKKRLNIHDAIAKIRESLNLMPEEKERQKLTDGIDELISELKTLRDSVSRFPGEEEKNKLSHAIHTLVTFFDSLNDKPLLAGIIFPSKKSAKKASVSPVNIDELFKLLEGLPTEKVLGVLSKQKKNTLLELATVLNITATSNLRKDTLVDRVFKLGFANRRGYDLLSGN